MPQWGWPDRRCGAGLLKGVWQSVPPPSDNQTPSLRYGREDAGMGAKLSEQSHTGSNPGREKVFTGPSDLRRPTGICTRPRSLPMLHKRATKPSFLNCTTLCWRLSPISQHQHNTTHDAETLQEDIDKLQTWDADWLMEFNPDKCEIIRITNRRKKKIVTNYSIHEHQLKEVKGAKYLGVTIDRTLSWNEHINNVTKKANSTRAFLQRNNASIRFYTGGLLLLYQPMHQSSHCVTLSQVILKTKSAWYIQPSQITPQTL